MLHLPIRMTAIKHKNQNTPRKHVNEDRVALESSCNVSKNVKCCISYGKQ